MKLLAAALAYAARGIFVVPTRRKVPLTPRGVHDGSIDADTIRSWWSRWPDAGIAIATGASGIVAADIDVKNGTDGNVTLARLEESIAPLPPTAASATPSGGRHLWFKAPLGIELRQSIGKVGTHDASGVDIRAGSSLCTAPPTTGYAWIDRHSLAPLPEAWVQAIMPKPRVIHTEPAWRASTTDDYNRARSYCVRAMQDEARELASTAPGMRNAQLWKSAAALGGLVASGGLHTSEIEAALSWSCSQWRDRNAAKDANTIRRGVAFGLSNPRHLSLGGSRAA